MNSKHGSRCWPHAHLWAVSHCCLQAVSRRILLLEHTLRAGLAVPGRPSGFTLLLSWSSVPFTQTALGRLWLCPF